MGLKVGDRVQFNRDATGAAKIQGRRVLLRGHTGTVRGFQGSLVVVEWDAGTYEVAGDIVATRTGLEVVTSGTVTLGSFEDASNKDWLKATAGGA